MSQFNVGDRVKSTWHGNRDQIGIVKSIYRPGDTYKVDFGVDDLAASKRDDCGPTEYVFSECWLTKAGAMEGLEEMAPIPCMAEDEGYIVAGKKVKKPWIPDEVNPNVDLMEELRRVCE